MAAALAAPLIGHHVGDPDLLTTHARAEPCFGASSWSSRSTATAPGPDGAAARVPETRRPGPHRRPGRATRDARSAYFFFLAFILSRRFFARLCLEILKASFQSFSASFGFFCRMRSVPW